jgi:hypothetical protein
LPDNLKITLTKQIFKKMKRNNKRIPATVIGLTIALLISISCYSQTLWETARKGRDVLTISTLFTAQDVKNHLSTQEGLDKAVKWCKETGITRVFIETFRGGYYAERAALEGARDRFLKEGLVASGCVTTVNVGKNGIGGWGATACYTDKGTLENLAKIFEYSASIFDLIMIDDFLFTECGCEDCITARGDESWSKFRCDLMVNVSREYILKPARAVNPKVKIIIKYPLWYDSFHQNGYEVVRESKDYDFIWVGTETRDYDYDVRPGGEVQYNAFFIMRWLGGIGGEKTGGGWIDALGTTPETYLEQVRQTVLGGGKEVMLFHYGDLIRDNNKYDGKPGTPSANIVAFRKELPAVIDLARIVKGKPLSGIDIAKLPNSEPFNEQYIFSFLGMLGLPLIPGHDLNVNSKSAIFTVHALKEPGFSVRLKKILDSGKNVLITDNLAKLMSDQKLLDNHNLMVLKTGGDPKNLLKMKQEELKPVRDHLLAPLGMQFDAPNKVSFWLLGNNTFIVENFNDNSVDVTLQLPGVSDVRRLLVLPADGNVTQSKEAGIIRLNGLSPRTLVAFEYK